MHRLQNRDGDFASHESAEALDALAMVTACEEALHVPAEQAVASRRPQFQGPPEPAPHDSDGNMTHGPLPVSPGANCTLVWDGENRLIEVLDGTGSSATSIVKYTYDASSRRISRSVPESPTTLYVYDGWNVVAEYTGSTPALARTQTWGLDLSGSLQGAGGVGGLLAVNIGGNRYYPTFDGNGNVSEYLTTSGVVATHFEYDPFGNLTYLSEQSPGLAALFDYRFSTKPVDPVTGWFYYLYRWYDPVTGRWPSRDPIEEEGFKMVRRGGPKVNRDIGRNLYDFVINGSVNRVDYLGLIVICCRAGNPEPSDQFLTRIALPHIRHCEIRSGDSCPASDRITIWTEYAVTIDRSTKRKMTGGKCCKDVTEQEVSDCLQNNKSFEGGSRYGTNCQTGTMTAIGRCCAKTEWTPDLISGANTRGRCLRWSQFLMPVDPAPERVCLEWEFPNGFNNGIPGNCGG